MDYEVKCCELQKQLDDAEKVIEFYGDKENTHRFDPQFDYQSRFDIDSGKRARAYLDKYKDKQ